MSDTEPISNQEAVSEPEKYEDGVRKVVDGVKQKYPHAFVEKTDEKARKMFFFPNISDSGFSVNGFNDREKLDNWEGKLNNVYLMTDSGVFFLEGDLNLRGLNLTTIADKCEQSSAKTESDFHFYYRNMPLTNEDGGIHESSQLSLIQTPFLKERFEKSEEIGKIITERRESAEKAKQAFSTQDVLNNL